MVGGLRRGDCDGRIVEGGNVVGGLWREEMWWEDCLRTLQFTLVFMNWSWSCAHAQYDLGGITLAVSTIALYYYMCLPYFHFVSCESNYYDRQT